MILVADTVPLFAECLAEGLRIDHGLFVVAEYPQNGPSAIATAVRTSPEIALVDFSLPDMDGSIVARHILMELPFCRVVLLSPVQSTAFAKEAASAGAAALVLKSWSLGRVAHTIRLLTEQRDRSIVASLPSGHSVALEETTRGFADLTSSEIEVLALLARGFPPQEISKRLGITPGSVRNRVSRILRKTGTRSGREAVARARSSGYLR